MKDKYPHLLQQNRCLFVIMVELDKNEEELNRRRYCLRLRSGCLRRAAWLRNRLYLKSR